MKKTVQKLNIVINKAKAMKMACVQTALNRVSSLSREIAKSFNFGKMSGHQARMAVLISGIVFTGYVMALQKMYYNQLLRDIPKPITIEDIQNSMLEIRISEMVKGTPIEIMTPYIAKKDRKTAAYLIGIARKESNWGKRKPVLNGEDCYNYWGFRGKSETMGSGGHTCFSSPEEAVNVVAKRIEQIIKRNKVESAKNMLVWKCGYSCAAHNPESVTKWIKDVDLYAEKILN